MAMTTIEVFADMPGMFLETLAGLFFVVIVGKFTHNESRLVMTAIAGGCVYPHPATLFAVGLLALVFKAFDFVNLVRGD